MLCTYRPIKLGGEASWTQPVRWHRSRSPSSENWAIGEQSQVYCCTWEHWRQIKASMPKHAICSKRAWRSIENRGTRAVSPIHFSTWHGQTFSLEESWERRAFCLKRVSRSSTS